MKRLLILVAIFFATIPFGQSVSAQNWSGSQNWYPYVIAPRSQRAAIQATPIVQRANRPLHVYGNVVRRANQRSLAGRRGFIFR